jgi:2-polyprenyl-6-methoxyphenol hydroxylase-like FAD-dependent oxidoreductase
MKVLIAGAGIAGLMLAPCLRRAGHEPLVVETAPRTHLGSLEDWRLS